MADFLSTYEVIQKIGSGSVGQVFQVGHKKHHPAFLKGKQPAHACASLPLELAVKVIEKPAHVRSSQVQHMVQREIDIHRALVHPNIVSLYNAYDVRKSLVLVQRYYPDGKYFIYICIYIYIYIYIYMHMCACVCFLITITNSIVCACVACCLLSRRLGESL